MNKLTRFLSIGLFLSFAVFFLSCKEKITNKTELIAYINDPENGLQKCRQAGKIKAVLTYKPLQLTSVNINQDKPGTAKAGMFRNNLFFVLSLSANNKELIRQLPFDQYSEMVQVMAFRMNNFIDIIPNNDRPVAPLSCTFQPTYGMGTANNLLIVFDKKKLLTAHHIKVHIKEFGLNIGDLYFDIAVSDIKKIQNIVVN
ncbi:hypothetical protein [Mucilaginibacter phyllosphaerae]|uniref:Uncharacterized protein n=1 Tax=Mucilaginibacter phyllosphaerae TaxID=1812349 RepID=A0A4Y8A616_9SPHI|nr:hypothetical protein [Mucilaginibacter phyllosphaerae]MBB3971049.1 hypothetical protein [Mucilaginibacter phyllosphaerae]TEW63789.1 hypothetical protein E2R65_18655 [Mucilaginibacter phyllosphaerae]GGH22179.1 hypothetical protein GCM10007352_35320 [Mucilaginibacter phyllosphaerae]